MSKLKVLHQEVEDDDHDHDHDDIVQSTMILGVANLRNFATSPPDMTCISLISF